MDFAQKRGAFENPASLVYPRKFDTAIRDTFSAQFHSNVAREQQTYDDLLITTSEHVNQSLSEWIEDESLYAQILSGILFGSIQRTSNRITSDAIIRAYKLTLANTRLQLHYCNKNNHTYLKGKILNDFDRNTCMQQIPKVVHDLLQISQEFSTVITLSNEMYSARYYSMEADKRLIEQQKHNHYYIPHMDITLVWNHELCVVTYLTHTFLLPKAYILMIHNKLNDLISVLILVHSGRGSLYPHETFNDVVNTVKELCRLCIRYKRQYFHIAKVLEGIVIGETLIEHEKWSNEEFLLSVTEDLREKTGFQYIGSPLQGIFLRVDSAVRHELGCLSKIVGHPLVSMESGAKALFTKTTQRSPINISRVQECINHFKRDYIKTHLNHYGKWPPCQLNTPCISKALEMSFIYNKDPDSLYTQRRWGHVSVDDYYAIDVLPNMNFHKLENIIPYLKDKTISILRSSVVQKYINHEPAETSWKDTRLLLCYLLNPSMMHDHIKYLDKYTNASNLDTLVAYLTIRIVPKEKEEKVDFRGFGCKTYEDRHRSLAQEKNVMRFLDDFSDEQAMTLTELSLLKKLNAFRRITSAYVNHTPLYIVIDSSSWNNKFRSQTVDIMMEDTLDKIFDSPIFSKTHKAYEKTLLYVPDKNCTYYWEGQAGGIEGLNQDTWVVVYLSQIKVALHQFDFKYHILCKGDDLRITVLLPNEQLSNQEIHQIKNQIVERISAVAAEFGHKINIEESYGSCQYLAFSKSASIGLVELPQTFRKIQKTYGANNAFINTMDDYAGSSFSNAHSACKTSPVVLPCYMTGCFWFYFYLTTSQTYLTCSDDEIQSMALIPSIVGGLPIIYLHNMFVRAESDLLSPFLDLINFTNRLYPNIYDVIINFCYVPMIPPTSYVGLYKDPYSLPSTRPSLPATALRNTIIEPLKKMTKNKDIMELFKAVDSPSNAQILSILDSSNVLRAKVLSALYAATPEGVLGELLRKFESGRSIHEVLILRYRRGKTTRILRYILRCDLKLQQWRVRRLKRQNQRRESCYTHLLSECPAESAHKIREYAWGKTVEDITMPPLQHQLHLVYAVEDTRNSWANENHFTMHTNKPDTYLTDDKREQYAVGSYSPFIGFTTRTSMLQPHVHFIEKDVLLSKIKNVIDLSSWCNVSSVDSQGVEVSSNINEVIRLILSYYTDIPLEDLSPFQGKRKSGTVQHHMRSPHFRESIIPNTLSNIYTRVRGESNSHITLRYSGAHFRINFLHVYCYMAWLCTQELEVGTRMTTPSLIWGVTTQCTFCNEPILETPLRFDTTDMHDPIITPLRLTRLGELSEQILTLSIDDFKKNSFMTHVSPSQLEISHAAFGIMQELVQTFYFTRSKLQDRFTQTSINADGLNTLSILTGERHQRLISLTELKKIPMRDASQYLLSFMSYIIPKYCPQNTKEEIELWLVRTPANELPWHDILGLFYDAGRLAEFVTSLHMITNVPTSDAHHNLAVACRYVALCYVQMLQISPPAADFVVLSYYTPEHIVNLGSLILHSRYKMNMIILQKEYSVKRLKFERESLKVKKTMINSRILILLFHILCSDYEAIITPVIDDLTQGDVVEVFCYNEDNLTMEAVENFITDNFDGFDVPKVIKGLCQIVQIWIGKINMVLDVYLEENWSFLAETILRFLKDKSVNVIYSTITACIECVRAIQKDDNGSDEMDNVMALEEHREELSSQLFLIQDRVPYPNLTLKANHYKEPVLEQQIPVWDSITNGSLTLHKNIIHKSYGTSNSSPTVLLEALRILDLHRKLPQGRNYLCMSDGAGGFTNTISSLTYHSKIRYHTIPENPYIEISPVSQELGCRDNVVECRWLLQGYHDLEKWSTIQYILDTHEQYFVITFDGEIQMNSRANYRLIMCNICLLCVLTKEMDSTAIIRLQLEGSEVNMRVIQTLSHYYREVVLYYPTSETYGNSAYLICVGSLNNTIESASVKQIFDSKLADSVKTRYTRFLPILRQHFLQGLITESKALNLSSYHTKLNELACTLLGIYPLAHFSKTFKVAVDTSSLLQAANSYRNKNIQHTLDKSGFDMTNIIYRLRKGLSHTDVMYYTQQTWTTDTQAHRRVLLAELFMRLGYQCLYKSFNTLSDPFIVRLGRLKACFAENYRSLDTRDRTFFDWECLEDMRAELLDNDRYLYEAFITGAKSMIMIYAWLCDNSHVKRNLSTRAGQ